MRAWGEVYEGNHEDPKRAVMAFLAENYEYVHRQHKTSTDPITMEDVKNECKSCRPSAAGPDGFEPAEMAMLSDMVYEQMAALLSNIESGAE